MKNGKEFFIKNKISQMTLKQKIGQLFVLGHAGTIITPEIVRRIRTFNPSGIRAGLMWRVRTLRHDPNGFNSDYANRVKLPFRGGMKDFVPNIPVPHCTNEEFCHYLNTLKEISGENELGIPLHITIDMEGDVIADYYRGGIKYFPSCMGIAKSGDPKTAYDVAWAVGRQLMPLGFNWIHSPVLDINSNPLNPEIGTRSYAQTEDEVIRFALEALKGYIDSGIISTGKHFPGRGPSAADAHHGMPVITEDKETLMKHLAPYKALIAEGLPCIMTAHTAYPALDPSGLPATLSKIIITDLLKGEMGFKGVVTTDEITMGGIIENHDVTEACIMAINAGCDLILVRDESPHIDKIVPAMIEAVLQNKLSEERIEDAIYRTLSVKYDYNMFENNIKDVSKADEGILDQKVAEIARRSAESAIKVMIDEPQLLPVSKDKRILLIEQINPLHERTNSQTCHPSLLWMKMLDHSQNVGVVETLIAFNNDDMERVKERLGETDIIIITNYFDRRHACTGDDFVKDICNLGKPVIVVTNSPYPFTVCDKYKTVIVTYGSSPETMEAVANTIFGEKIVLDSSSTSKCNDNITVIVESGLLNNIFEQASNISSESTE